MEWKATGKKLPEFVLPSSREAMLGPGAFRQKRNVLLILIHDGECRRCRELIGQVAVSFPRISSSNTEALAVVAGPKYQAANMHKSMAPPFVFLFDPDDAVATRLLAQEAPRRPALVVADRYGRVWCAVSAEEHDDGPVALDTAMNCLEFIELQCPECDVPDEPPLPRMP